MENREYLLQLRNMQASQRSIMRRYSELLLEYLNADKYKDVLTEIAEQLLRLNTLDIFDPNECYMQWLQFVQVPELDKFLLSFLKTVRFSRFIYIWNCSSNEKKSFFLCIKFKGYSGGMFDNEPSFIQHSDKFNKNRTMLHENFRCNSQRRRTNANHSMDSSFLSNGYGKIPRNGTHHH